MPTWDLEHKENFSVDAITADEAVEQEITGKREVTEEKKYLKVTLSKPLEIIIEDTGQTHSSAIKEALDLAELRTKLNDWKIVSVKGI